MTDSPLQILTVSELNRKVKIYLEQDVGEVAVLGEISNCIKASSGHIYFTLKDANAQIKAVYFRNRHTPIAYQLKDGQQVEAIGRLSLYEARGDYQLIVERLEEAGLGDLHRQFELLKQKLQALGLFDAARKRPIPKFVHRIGIITSPTGAALKDMLTTLNRRYPLVEVILYPCEVQGKTAPKQLIDALDKANRDAKVEVILLARGGGSLEDLWAFNDEALAYAVSQSTIPVISGVGHETDFTIVDFVADLRAATPTASATLVTPDKIELLAFISSLQQRLHDAMKRNLLQKEMHLTHIKNRLLSPDTLIAQYWQTLDYLEKRLMIALEKELKAKTHRLHVMYHKLLAQNPITLYERRDTLLKTLLARLNRAIVVRLDEKKQKFNQVAATLHMVSPLATLSRGYSITTQNTKVIMNAHTVEAGSLVDVTLFEGKLRCEVKSIEE